jgi:hypothetical protein
LEPLPVARGQELLVSAWALPEPVLDL